MTAAAGAVIGLFAIWLLAGVVSQFRVPAVNRWRRYDPIGFLPSWNLFSPRPITSDLLVRYRVWAAADAPLEWRELGYPGARGLMDGIASRRRRPRRAIYVRAEQVVRLYIRYREDPDVVVRSVPYVHLLTRVTRELAPERPWGVQFQVVRTAGLAATPAFQPLFRSRVHRV